MRFDTFNFTLVSLAAFLFAIAFFRSQALDVPVRPRNPIGFQP